MNYMLAYRCSQCWIVLQDHVKNGKCDKGHFVRPELDFHGNHLIVEVSEERWLKQKLSKDV